MASRNGSSINQIKALLFDFGGTLAFLDYDLLASEFSRPGRRITAEDLERAEYKGRAAIDRAMGAVEQDPIESVYRTYFGAWMVAAGIPESEVDGCAARFTEIHREASLWRVVRPGIIDALERFRSAGLKLAIVSNAEGNVESDARRFGLHSLFDTIIDSHIVGVSKPDPRIFQIALDRLGVSPQQALFAGDIYSIDMLGARAAGMEGKLIDVMNLYSWIEHPRIRGIHEFHEIEEHALGTAS